MKINLRLKAYASLLLLSCFSLAGVAATFRATINGVTYVGDDAHMDWGATVEKMDGSLTGAVVIPQTVVLGGKTFVVKKVGGFIFKNYPTSQVTSITLPVTVWSIENSAFGISNKLEEIKFAGVSNFFTVEDGVLYNKDKSRLVYFPVAKDATGFVIPASVKTLGGSAFSHNKSLTSIVIPATVTAIENGGGDAGIGVYGAFEECTNLHTVTFAPGSTIAKIPDFCFNDCSSLENINIPASVKVVSYYGMSDCEKFRGPIPATLEKIGSNAFEGCHSLTEVILPATVNAMGSSAFNYCRNIAKVVIPDNSPLTEVPANAFSNNYKLADLQLSDKIVAIRQSAFKGCSALPEVTLPPHLKILDDRAFEDCSKLKKAVFSNEVEKIGNNAFANCRLLDEYTIPASVKTIGIGAFMFTAATTVNIPAGVTSIGGAAFARNKNLTAFTVEAANAAYKEIEGVLFTKDMKTLVAYPAASVRKVSYTVPAGVEILGEGAFSDSRLTHVTLPSSLKTLYNGAFAYSANLAELTIPASVTEINRMSGSHLGMYYDHILKQSGVESLYLLNATTPPTILDPENKYLSTRYNFYPTVYVKKTAYDGGIYQNAAGWKKMPNFAYEIPAKMTDSGIATLGRDFDVDLSQSDVTAYVATAASATGGNIYVTMREVSVAGKTAGKYIPSRTGTETRDGVSYEKYTGVVLKGTASGTFTYRIGEDDAAVVASADNYLVSVTDPTQIAPTKTVGGTAYTNLLLNKGKFRYATATGTVPYNRSCLSLPSSVAGTYHPAAPAKAFIFLFEHEGTTTSIDALPAGESAETGDKQPWYNLQGVRVSRPQRGVNIQGGKKVLVK